MPSPITILTSPPIPTGTYVKQNLLCFARNLKRRLLSQPPLPGPAPLSTIGGPAGVRHNLLSGLDILKAPYFFNPPACRVTDCVGVLSGIEALAWAIQAKKKGRIRKLLAGPNLVVTPDERDSILADPAIDRVVTPAPWVSQWYASIRPRIATRLVEWPVGVDEQYWSDVREPSGRKYDFVVFSKFQHEKSKSLLQPVTAALSQRSLAYHVLEYGAFQREDFRALLRDSRAMIYLTETESQGIAQFEAWACDVPTLVWSEGTVRWRDYSPAPASASPYLTPSCGMFFQGPEDFPEVLDKFRQNLSRFEPRKFIQENYTLAKSAQAYLRLFSEDGQPHA